MGNLRCDICLMPLSHHSISCGMAWWLFSCNSLKSCRYYCLVRLQDCWSRRLWFDFSLFLHISAARQQQTTDWHHVNDTRTAHWAHSNNERSSHNAKTLTSFIFFLIKNIMKEQLQNIWTSFPKIRKRMQAKVFVVYLNPVISLMLGDLQWLEIGGYSSKPSVSDQAGVLKIRNDFFNEILLQDFHFSHRWVDCGLFLRVGELNGRFHKKPFMWKYKWIYYRASSVSGQDKPNRAAIGHPNGQDGTILPARDYPPCPTKKFPESQIINLSLSLWTTTRSRSKNKQKKKKKLGQYPAILTSRLVNNAYIFLISC